MLDRTVEEDVNGTVVVEIFTCAGAKANAVASPSVKSAHAHAHAARISEKDED